MRIELKNILASFRVEWFKLKKSHLIEMVLAGFVFLLLIKRGASWPVFLQSATMLYTSVIGMVGFGVISSWVFAREYTDGVYKDLLALPISRKDIIISKLMVIEISELLIGLLAIVIAIVGGMIFAKTGFSIILLRHTFKQMVELTFLNVMLSFLWPLLASVWKSAILPMSLSFVAVIVSVIFASKRIGQFIPWSIPGYYLANNTVISHESSLLLILVATIGIYGTIYVWSRLDQK